ncbi:6685_t:CDS:2, partial [Racocetra persica]
DILWKIHDFSDRSHTGQYLAEQIEKSHLSKNLLESKIKKKKIKGGGLKTYVNTRWTTAYEMLYSIYQLESCLKEVINENPNIITSEIIHTIILRKRGFFQD